MSRERAILAVRYTPVAPQGQLRKAVGGFLRYVQYRDHHQEAGTDREVSSLLKYVAYRDRTSPRGRLFGREAEAGDLERRELGAYIARSVRDLQQRQGGRPERAVYRFVLSPERAEGLDLKQLTRATMARLERDAGPGGLPRWIAAEHRNTAHPHVHVVMAARREVEPGRFRTLILTRQRLASMKQGLQQELELQRGDRTRSQELMRGYARSASQRSPDRVLQRRRRWQRSQHRRNDLARTLQRLAAHYRREAEREAEMQRWARERDHGWERG